jgi:uncharacterized protein
MPTSLPAAAKARWRRTLEPTLRQRATQYPVVTLTGPRQSGKTTLARATFPDHAYLSLERPDHREFALADPRGFIASLPARGVVLDEVHRVPALLSWLQQVVDEDPRPGRFILTGSHAVELMATVTQSLAGRSALLNLLPMSLAELRAAGVKATTDHLIFGGGYPRIHADKLDPTVALGDYFATYVERDLRQIIELRNLEEFRRFVRMVAGRSAQLLNLQSLAADVGISGHTAKAWLGLLETSFIVRRLEPWFINLGKRLVKTPKLYFCDTGLAAWLIGITHESQLATHPLRGALFENLVVMEFVKHALHAGQRCALNFYRDSSGLEADLVVEQGFPPGRLGLVEIKSSRTLLGEHLRPLLRVKGLLADRVDACLCVHDSDDHYLREGVEVVGLHAPATVAA